MRKNADRLDSAQPAFSLIESLRWADGYQRMDLHLARLARSAAALHFPFDYRRALACLAEQEKTLKASVQHPAQYKVRLELDQQGESQCASEPLPAAEPEAPLTVTLSPLRTDSANPLLRHKTTSRLLYDRERYRAKLDGHADVIFRNERDEVTEGAISNVFARFGARLVTPPVRCGLLPGIARALALAERPEASEAVLTVDDLEQADELFICNAVRGWRRVTVATWAAH